MVQVRGQGLGKGKQEKNFPTGDIEVEAISVKILNKGPRNPPMIIADETDALEELRMKYRYLDLRRPGDAEEPHHQA